jgi:hypothetical protein
MGTLNQELPTLMDLARRWDPNGGQAQIVEALARRSAILEDMVWQEGNLPTGHRFTTRTGLPALTWRKFNEGVAPSKSQTAQLDETTGMLEGKSVVDCELVRLNGNSAAFRGSENLAFLAAFNNEMETGLFYHSTKNAPENLMGLAPRLDSLTGAYGKQIIVADPAAAGNDQTSMYLVGWGPDTAFGIYPKGMQGGLETHDMGVTEQDDGTGKKFRAYTTYWNWKIGLVVKDARYAVRICNIDTGGGVAISVDLLMPMISAYYRMENTNNVRPVFYANRLVAEYLHRQAIEGAKNLTVTERADGGGPVTRFMGIPIRITDAILNTESVVT